MKRLYTILYTLFNRKGFKTMRAGDLSKVGFAKNKLKVLKAVVGFYAVLVVDYFLVAKSPAKSFFHNRSMLKYVSSFICWGSCFKARVKNHYITIFNMFPTAPRMTIASFRNFLSFFKMTLSSISLYMRSFKPRWVSFFKTNVIFFSKFFISYKGTPSISFAGNRTIFWEMVIGLKLFSTQFT